MRRITALLTAVVLALAGAVLVASPAAAATVTVTSSADSGLGTLRAAVAAAAPGDTIEFDASVTTIELASTIQLPRAVIIDGGGDVTISRAPATAFTQFYLYPDDADQDYVIRNITFVGAATSTGNAIAGSYGPTNELPRDITLSNVTVRNQTNSYAPIGEFYQTVGDILVENSVFEDNVATAAFAQGGLVVNAVSGSSVRIVDSEFRRNTTTTGDGGALHFVGMSVPTIEITGSTFEDNTAGRSGGAALFESVSSAVTVTNSSFLDNGAQSGGAIRHVLSGALTASGSTFEDNSATADGGAIFSGSDRLTVSSSTFDGNAATSYAGAIWADTSDVDISTSSFVGNSANNAGAVYVPGDATTTISSSTFRANTFAVAGGGLLSDGSLSGSITIDSSTFSDHAFSAGGTPRGAAIDLGNVVSPGSFTLSNSTIDESLATGSALSVATVASDVAIRHSTLRGASFGTGPVSNATVVVENSVVEALDASDDPLFTNLGAGGALEVSYSILSGALPAGSTDGGGNLVDTDPQLGALASNGGPTQTRLPQPGSPAIDAGNPAFAPPPAVDQRGAGFARVTYGRLDIGAVEVQAQMHPATGGVVSWWLLPVAGGVLLLGIGGILLARRGHGAKHSAR